MLPSIPILLVAAFAPPAVCEQAWPDAAQVADLLAQVPGRAPGFEASGQAASYDAQTLRGYLGDEAGRCLDYDYRWTVAGEFIEQRSAARIAIEVHRFGDDLDAFGAFSKGRDPGPPGQIVPVADQVSVLTAYWSGNQVHIWRGPLYVRVAPRSSDASRQAAALTLAQAVVGQLPAPQQSPGVMKVAPARDLIPEALKFQRHGVLGSDELGGALLGAYGRRQPGKLLVYAELLLFGGTSLRSAESTFDLLKRLLGEAAQPQAVDGLGEKAFALRHPDHGRVYVMRQGRYVAMLRRVTDPEMAEVLLREIAKNARLR